MLVTLEGLDGAGKTTVWEELRERHPDAVFTREPTESWYGEAVRRSIGDDDADPLADLFLLTADHADHLATTVRPALAEGRLVVSDRFSDSRYAYQGATLQGVVDDPMAYVQRIHEPFTVVPDHTILFDVDPAVAAERAGATDKFERVDYLTEVRENYERLVDADPDRWTRVDASQDLAAVQRDVEAKIDEILD
jgi:dTMP kinase